ncbi:MAG: hypothetical protein WCJ56_02510 [bacterium]
MPIIKDNKVLIVGVYMPATANYVFDISAELLRTRDWQVNLRWATVGGGAVPEGLRDLTLLEATVHIPKFVMLNRLLATIDIDPYAFLVVIDDDIELPEDFLNQFLTYQQVHNFTLAQPALTQDSYISHYFNTQQDGVAARWTRFVEIGPLFSLRRDGYSHLLPFDERAPMGWGLDLVWPIKLETHGLRLGIIDALPIRHALRKSWTNYNYHETNQAMLQYLADQVHLPISEAFCALQTHLLGDCDE